MSAMSLADSYLVAASRLGISLAIFVGIALPTGDNYIPGEVHVCKR